MDKTLEIVIAVTVLLMTAVSVMFMVSDRAGSFGTWANETSEGAQCDLLKAEYENSCNCDTESGDSDIRTDAVNKECDWPSEGGGYTCTTYCP